MRSTKLGDICEFKYGKALPRPMRVEGKFPVFGSNGSVGTHAESCTEAPTIIIGRKGSIGEIHYSSNPCWPIDTTYYIDCSATRQNIRWLYFALKFLRLTELNKATGVPGLNRNDAYERKLLLPPLEEQCRIAAILDKAAVIDNKRSKIVGEADALLRATFLDMFGHPAALVGEYPLLSDVADVSRGRFSPRPRNDPTYYNGQFPFIQTGEIAASDGYLSDFHQTLNQRGTNVSKRFPSGTVFIAIVGATIGATAVSTRDFWCPDSVIGIVPKNKCAPSEFIEYLLRFWKPIFLEKAPETARANINLQTLRPINIPGIGTNKPIEFARIYKSVHRIKSQLQSQGQELLPSLMQRAFAGAL
jgi:type I restriction enzyme S subunit